MNLEKVAAQDNLRFELFTDGEQPAYAKFTGMAGLSVDALAWAAYPNSGDFSISATYAAFPELPVMPGLPYARLSSEEREGKYLATALMTSGWFCALTTAEAVDYTDLYIIVRPKSKRSCAVSIALGLTATGEG